MKDGIPIDKTDNCERMLKTGQYQTDTMKDKEDWWFIKYLKIKYKKKGLSEQELKKTIKAIWAPIFNTRFAKEEEQEYIFYVNRRFEDIYNSNKNIVLTPAYHSIIIYQNELDYINSLPAPKWFREFVFIFLGHCKTTKKFIWDFAPISIYAPYLSLKVRDKDIIGCSTYSKLNSFGLWKDLSSIVVVEDNVHGNTEELWNSKFEFQFPVPEFGPVAIKFDRQIDLLRNLDLITNKYRCKICGEEFEINNRTQRLICDKCYKKQRNKNKHRARDNKKKEEW